LKHIKSEIIKQENLRQAESNKLNQEGGEPQ